MSYSSLTSSKINLSTPFYNENTNNPYLYPKSSFQKEGSSPNDLKKNGSYENASPNKLSYSMVLKDKSPEECIILIKEMIVQMENIYKEMQRVAYISEELMNENMVWKEEYNKLKLTIDPNSNDSYEKNFIRRLADLQSLLAKKDDEINKKSMILKKLENENAYLKREIELKKEHGGASPTQKTDLRTAIMDLENKNSALIKKINLVRNETLHEI